MAVTYRNTFFHLCQLWAINIMVFWLISIPERFFIQRVAKYVHDILGLHNISNSWLTPPLRDDHHHYHHHHHHHRLRRLCLRHRLIVIVIVIVIIIIIIKIWLVSGCFFFLLCTRYILTFHYWQNWKRVSSSRAIAMNTRAAKHIHCAQNGKTVRLCTYVGHRSFQICTGGQNLKLLRF